MGTISATEQAASVPGELHYLARESTVLRRFTAPGASINTGSYEPHTVPIRNGRPMQDAFRTDIHGFEISSHRSAVSEFTDKAVVDAMYIPEVIEFVKERTGADQVVSRGAVLRRSVAPAEHASQPQTALVHIDYGPEGAAMTAPGSTPGTSPMAPATAGSQPAVLRRPSPRGPVRRGRRIDDHHQRLGVPLQP
jgi:hypothetical protein